MALDYKQRSDKAGNDHEVVVISEKDGGLYDAMNKGIRRATGDYIVFLNAGDTFPNSDTLETIVASIGDGETLLACSMETPISWIWITISCVIAG